MSKPMCQVKFSPDDDSALIGIVSNYEILWKLNHPDFKNNLKKDKVWNGIGQKLNKTGESCKKRWKSIRDHFMREKKAMTGTVKTAKRKKRASYWESLCFLNNVEHERGGFTNVGEENEIAAAGTENHTVQDNSDKANVTGFNLEDDYKTAEITDDLSEQGEIEDASELIRPCTSTSQSTKNTSTNNRPLNKDKNNELIISLLQQRNSDKTNLMDCVEKFCVEEQKPPENENDLFFKSMAAIVNKFEQRNQAVARKKIFAIVSHLEMSQYSTTTTPHSS